MLVQGKWRHLYMLSGMRTFHLVPISTDVALLFETRLFLWVWSEILQISNISMWMSILAAMNTEQYRYVERSQMSKLRNDWCIEWWIYALMYGWIDVFMYVYMNVCMLICVYLCMYMCMYACMYIFIYSCMYVWITRLMYTSMNRLIYICMYCCIDW